MGKFIPGMQLSEQLYTQIVKEIITRSFPKLKYSAGLIDYGSDVLGYDNEVSKDHQWGPRLSIFLSTSDIIEYGEKLENTLSEQLPQDFLGFSTNFSGTKLDFIRHMEVPVDNRIKHIIRIHSLEEFFQQHLGLDIQRKFSIENWLYFPQQRLITIRKGKIFHDDLNASKIKQMLFYYPDDIWFYLLACEWDKISVEESFVGRCGDVSDEIGSTLIANRIIQHIMNICFLQEKQYIPYSKWFGTAFKELKGSIILTPIISEILHSKNWIERQAGFPLCQYSCRLLRGELYEVQQEF